MNIPFQVRSLGVIENKPLHTTPGTKEDDFMFNLFLSGKGFYKNHTLEKTIDQPGIAFFLPDDPGILVCDHDDPYHHYYLRYNGEYAKHLTNKIIEKYNSQFIYYENLPALEAILKIEGLSNRSIMRGELPEEMGILESKLSQILTLLLDDKEEDQKKRITASSLEVYLQSRLHQKLSLTEMAEDFHISSRQLNRHSKKYYGISIVQLHEKLKMNLAINLLDNSNLRINEIALRLGYSDPLHFSRVFKKREGISPINYIK